MSECVQDTSFNSVSLFTLMTMIYMNGWMEKHQPWSKDFVMMNYCKPVWSYLVTPQMRQGRSINLSFWPSNWPLNKAPLLGKRKIPSEWIAPHIKRKKNLLTESLEGKIEGKRPRGRPRNVWMSDIKAWTGQSAYACTQKAADRTLGVSLLVNRRRGDDTPR